MDIRWFSGDRGGGREKPPSVKEFDDFDRKLFTHHSIRSRAELACLVVRYPEILDLFKSDFSPAKTREEVSRAEGASYEARFDKELAARNISRSTFFEMIARYPGAIDLVINFSRQEAEKNSIDSDDANSEPVLTDIQRFDRLLEARGISYGAFVRQVIAMPGRQNSPIVPFELRLLRDKRAEFFGRYPERFRSLVQKLRMVELWPGVDQSQLRRAVELAEQKGLFKRLEQERKTNPFVDVVISFNQRTFAETVRYAIARLRDVYGDGYDEFTEEGQSVFDDAELLSGGRPFNPSTITIQLIDFGYNSEMGQISKTLEDIRHKELKRVADVGVLFAAAQNPGWVGGMEYDQDNGRYNVPPPVAAGIVLRNQPYRKGELLAPRISSDLRKFMTLGIERDMSPTLQGSVPIVLAEVSG